MYYWRIFLWENGAKSTEFTQYAVAPIFIEDRLDEALDTAEVVLDSMPIETKKAFPPKTKFRLERYLTADYADTPRKWDLIVEHDDVEEYAGCPEICCHRVNLIEASAVAQGMHVDNIALTYELQDVSLEYKTVLSKTDTLGDLDGVTVENNGHDTAIHSNPPMQFGTVYFQNSYRYIWSGEESIKSILYEQDARTAHEINFTIPTLTAHGNLGNGWDDLFEMQTNTKVIRRHFNKDKDLLSETIVLERNCGPISFIAVKNDVYGITNNPLEQDPPPVSPNMYAYGVGIEAFNSDDDGIITSLNNLDKFSDHLIYYNISMSAARPDVDDKEVTFITDVLSEEQLSNGEYYDYEIKCISSRDRVPSFYECACLVWKTTGPVVYHNSTERGGGSRTEYVTGSSIYVSATMKITDLSTDVVGADFLVNARKYNCYDLLRKALLTCDTQVFDNTHTGLDNLQYFMTVDDKWINRLKAQSMYETVLEQKNLWEVLLQIGYYLHAIPYLEYAEDGTDRFVLRFKQLGATNIKENSSTKITVFNSRNLAEYFTQYDSYVTNLFSPQNLVDEWIVPKTSDSSYLVSNNTAELHVKYPIQEILEFDIIYNGTTATEGKNYIFEESVYSILNPNVNVRPSKASALYYKLGNNKIFGLNYTPPSKNNDAPYALKNIMSSLFGISAGGVKFNDIKFHIKYRTQDSLRISQLRPDLHTFMKNSSYEKYPHHEQFYGQQDKIVDSERFSANLWGKLVRVGNAVYQCQEYSQIGQEKESGDLVYINGEVYYVVEVENEFYQDAVFQKVTYSKNFNQLSNIVTIPSEPRFYEVSERSQVRREVRLNDFFLLTTERNLENIPTRFMSDDKWKEFLKNLLFKYEADPALPNFAYTRFKADAKRQHTGSYNQVLPIKQLFPSVEVELNPETNSVIPKQSSDHRDVIVPLLHFPLKNAITFVWDMDDNFKAGDCIDIKVNGKNDTTDEAYYSLQSVRYCDIMGRADLLSFKLFDKTDWTINQARRLPFAEDIDFTPTDEQSIILLPNSLSIGLDKDNREALSFNYQINLLQENSSFVTFSNLFGKKESKLKMCCLNKEVSMFDELVSLTDAVIIKDNMQYQLIDDEQNAIQIKITTPIVNIGVVKSIVVYEEDEYGSKYAYIAKNVGALPNENKLQSWWIYPVFNQ